MSGNAEAAALGVVQVAAVLAAAPLLNGYIKKIKARLQFRHGPALLQGYRDIAKWLSRSEQVGDSSSYVSLLAPTGVLAATLAALLFVPVFGERTPLTASGDFIVVAGLLALTRALLTLGGMDSGGAFGQMGSSRELAVGALVEPVLVLSLVALALQPQSTRLGDMVAFGDARPADFISLGWLLAGAGFAVVLVAETGRIPVDNPDTHLELTMIHEGMLIEYSGRSLGMLHLAAMVKQLLLVVLLVNVFVPFGMARFDGAVGITVGGLLVTTKVALVGLSLAIVESAFAKRRLFELPDLIGAAGFAAMLGVALTVLFA
jgi:formate hydrogenlyase subunit 4